MQTKPSLSQGEILLILQRRSGRTVEEVAQKMDIHPSHLSKTFKSELLTTKIKKRAAELFGVPESIFDSTYEVPEMQVSEDNVGYKHKKRDLKLTIDDALRMLDDKDKRHHEERARLLLIIETLTNKIG